MVKNLYTKYTQKSRMFLYPLLGIRRGSSVVPLETYISIKGVVEPEDHKLVCLYHLRTDLEFRTFEKSKLQGNPRFHNFYEIEDDKGLYVFDFSDNPKFWDCLLTGRYSQIDKNLKTEILAFFNNNPKNKDLINSYLNPDNYFESYAKYLNVEKELLEEVGELCSIIDIEKETLVTDIKQPQFLSIFDL
jgi:hypothetical protein